MSIMKLSPSGHGCVVLAVATAFASLLDTNAGAQAVSKNAVRERVEAIASALRSSGVQLKAEDFEQTAPNDPPDAIASAGEEFSAAWREYQRALSLRSKSIAPPPGERGKNVLLNMESYSKLINALLNSDQPPQPEEFSPFFYSDYSWCGADTGTFAEENRQVVLLACLRNKRYGEAGRVLMADAGNSKVKADVLTALGFDVRKVFAGAWLAGAYGNLENLCAEGSEYAARLALRYAELHWDEAVARQARSGSGYYPAGKEPEIPRFQLLLLLRDGIEVRPETKQQISEFLSKNATRLYDHQIWLQKARPGTGKWLVGIAREALHHDKNAVRKLGEKVLHDAGEKDVQAELNPSAYYRLFVNGELWPLDRRGGYSHLGLSVRYQSNPPGAGLATDAAADNSGVISVDPDYFSRKELVSAAYFYSWPSSWPKPASVSEPWIHADIPLPPAFAQTTDIRIETVRLTIKPKLPRAAAEYEGKVTEVDFGVSEKTGPPSSTLYYALSGSEPLVIERVQPGAYWFRVRAPGAAITPWQKVQVTSKANVIEPNLKRGSTVVVPLAWPASLKLEELHPDIADMFRRQWWMGLPGMFVLEQNGKPFELPTDLKHSDREENVSSDRLIFPGLPIGRYTLKMRSSDEVGNLLRIRVEPDHQYPGWKRTELTFDVGVKSPAELRTEPLKVVLAD
jgi:hypothetical protein